MRHLKAGKKLNRSPSHRKALYRNLTMALIQHERITTTVAKAKGVRPFVEKLITLAKKGTLHARRLAISRLGTPGNAVVDPSDAPEADTRTVIQKLFSELGPRFADRPGGYTRIIKRTYRRLGDAGETCYLELLQEGEEKFRAKAERAPVAPTIEDESEEEETEEEEAEAEATSEESSEDQGEETEEGASAESSDTEADKKEEKS